MFLSQPTNVCTDFGKNGENGLIRVDVPSFAR